jgi:catechol 2,3-dioxygenase-like lactoylglutathione lyase family enzyme
MITAEAVDLASLKEFYRNVLGLHIAEEDNHSFTMEIGQTELEFRQHTGNLHPVYHFAFNIPANKIEEAAAWMQKRVSLISPDGSDNYIVNFANWHAKSIYFFDPAGNILELIARFDLNNATDTPFSSQLFLSVSEVALAFAQEELETKTNQLLKDFHLGYFDKQPPLETFRAVGDDEGLFILSAEGRAWYPTKDRFAEPAPLKVYFSHGSADSLLEYDHELQSWSSSKVRFGEYNR